MSRQSGSTILYAVAALVLLGALAAAMSALTGSTTSQVLDANQASRARYAALSGISYAKALTATQLDAIRADQGGSQPMAMADDLRFVLTVAAPSGGVYPVASLGTAGAGTPREANCRIAATATPGTGTGVAITSGQDVALEQGVLVHGDVSGRTVTLKNLVAVTGNVSAESGLTLEQGAAITGTACAGSGDVVLQTGAIINGNVAVHGNLTLEAGAWIYGSVSVTGTITLKLGSAIYGTANVTAGEVGVTNYGGTIWGGVQALTTPVSCNLAAVPDPPVATGTSYPALTLENGQSQILTAGSYTYSSITLKYGSTLSLDLSAGLPLTLTVTGAVNLENGARLRIKTPTSHAYKSLLQLYAAGDLDHASLVYLKAEGAVILKLDATWYGTIFSRTSIDFEQGVGLIGAYASPGPVTLKTAVGLLAYVLADTAW